ncbi:MAG TPA: RNA methyltransferase [Bauldia sp.]|nr:RNA methyltransferase [Bauldia sp.]
MSRHPHSPRPSGPQSGYRPRSPEERRAETLWIYGIHAVSAALANPRREIRRLLATSNALSRLGNLPARPGVVTEPATPRDLDRLLGPDTVHQGVALEVAPLAPVGIEALANARLVVVLDQVTDPHNVGAIMRSAVAFAADAVVTTGRHAAIETGTLAKAASGALDRIAWIEVPNLARALEEIGAMGFTRVGLDSEATTDIEDAIVGERIALVLGAEGKGLRRLTRDSCDALARLSVPGAIASLNVSNAAVLALYIASRGLRRAAPSASGE